MAPTNLTHSPSAAARRVQLLTLAVLITGWELLARSGLLYDGVVPPTLQVLTALWRELSSASLYQHLGVTLAEILAGFVIASVAGVIAGIALGSRRFLAQMIDPFLSSLATTPKIIFLPIVMLMFGIGPASKVAVGALSGFFPIALSTMAGALAVRPVLINVGKAFHLNRWQMMTHIYLPSLVGPVIRGMRLGLGVTIIGVLLGEIKLANSGLGFLAIEYYNSFRIDHMYSILLVIFALAIVINMLMNLVSRRHDRTSQ